MAPELDQSQSGAGWRRSLRVRVVLISLVWIAAALVTTGYVLNHLFESHVHEQYQRQLQVYADYVLADIGQGPDGQPELQRPAQNPRLLQPLSGLYWQLNDVSGSPVLRSRSLWDQILQTPRDLLQDEHSHVHIEPGPSGQQVLLLEQAVRFEWDGSTQWRLLVAEDASSLRAAVAQWQRSLALFLSVLFVGLLVALVAQAIFGFAPLRRLQLAIAQLRNGRATRLQGDYPSEFAPLVEDFNDVLQANEKIIERARAQAGDLAHAIKTPVTIMTNAADEANKNVGDKLAFVDLVQQQLGVLQSTVDSQLRRARLAARGAGVAHQSSLVEPVLIPLIDVMRKLYASSELHFEVVVPDSSVTFAGDNQDLVEVLGNLLDNAGKWARHHVRVKVTDDDGVLQISVEDDGPGIDADQRSAVMDRGTRFDEQVQGSGLGLAIVRDLVQWYGGTLTLSTSPLGGLAVWIQLPPKR